MHCFCRACNKQLRRVVEWLIRKIGSAPKVAVAASRVVVVAADSAAVAMWAVVLLPEAVGAVVDVPAEAPEAAAAKAAVAAVVLVVAEVARVAAVRVVVDKVVADVPVVVGAVAKVVADRAVVVVAGLVAVVVEWEVEEAVAAAAPVGAEAAGIVNSSRSQRGVAFVRRPVFY